jgi:hypothetical protein
MNNKDEMIFGKPLNCHGHLPLQGRNKAGIYSKLTDALSEMHHRDYRRFFTMISSHSRDI